MEAFLIRAWNAVVGLRTWFFISAISMGLHDGDRVRSIFSRLMGRKVLILGNDDCATPNAVHPIIKPPDWEASVVAKAKERPFSVSAFLNTVDGGRTVATYSQNQTIYSQGDPANAVFYIQNGKVKVCVVSEQARKPSSLFIE